jgi:hypothetical protein
MKLRDLLSVLLGLKKPQLIPVPIRNNEKKN